MINDTLSLASVQKVTLLLFLSAFVAEANHTQAADDQKGSHSEWSMAVQTGLIHTVEEFVAFLNESVPKTPPIHTLEYCSEQLEGIERDDCAEATKQYQELCYEIPELIREVRERTDEQAFLAGLRSLLQLKERICTEDGYCNQVMGLYLCEAIGHLCIERLVCAEGSPVRLVEIARLNSQQGRRLEPMLLQSIARERNVKINLRQNDMTYADYWKKLMARATKNEIWKTMLVKSNLCDSAWEHMAKEWKGEVPNEGPDTLGDMFEGFSVFGKPNLLWCALTLMVARRVEDWSVLLCLLAMNEGGLPATIDELEVALTTLDDEAGDHLQSRFEGEPYRSIDIFSIYSVIDCKRASSASCEMLFRRRPMEEVGQK